MDDTSFGRLVRGLATASVRGRVVDLAEMLAEALPNALRDGSHGVDPTG